MSCSTVYAVYKTKVVCLADFSNGWGAGPPLWDYISLKCIGKKFPWYPPEDRKAFWPLWQSPKLDRDEAAVLLSTYDLGMVEMDHLEEFAHACELVHGRIIEKTEFSWNHFASIGKLARSLAAKHDYRCKGLGLNCTSVNDVWLDWRPKTKQPWGIYEELDRLATERGAPESIEET